MRVSTLVALSAGGLLWAAPAMANQLLFHPTVTVAFEDDLDGGDDDFNDIAVRAQIQCEFNDGATLLLNQEFSFVGLAAGGQFTEALLIDLPGAPEDITLNLDIDGANQQLVLMSSGVLSLEGLARVSGQRVELFSDFRDAFPVASGFINTSVQATVAGHNNTLEVGYGAGVAASGDLASCSEGPQFLIQKRPEGTPTVELTTTRPCLVGGGSCPMAGLFPADWSIPIERTPVSDSYPTFPGGTWYDSPVAVLVKELIAIPPPLASCVDGSQNGAETGLDCGGPVCPACPGNGDGDLLTFDVNVNNAIPGAIHPDQTACVDNADPSFFSPGTLFPLSSVPTDGLTVDSLGVGGCDIATSLTENIYPNQVCEVDQGAGGIAKVRFTSIEYTQGPLAGFVNCDNTCGLWAGDDSHVCVPDLATTCNTGSQDGDESGVDCGGTQCLACPTCSDGIKNQDEFSVDCGGVCTACGFSCDDEIQNGSEEDIDCGGPDCAACPTCFDELQNGDEEGVDCGGSCPNVCPTCDDGLQNGQETDEDCGGPDCAPCEYGYLVTYSSDFTSLGGGVFPGHELCVRDAFDLSYFTPNRTFSLAPIGAGTAFAQITEVAFPDACLFNHFGVGATGAGAHYPLVCPVVGGFFGNIRFGHGLAANCDLDCQVWNDGAPAACIAE